ncbi:PIR protein [Plasmodium vivax]|nr:PIR protein [Plasmodium vivax]
MAEHLTEKHLKELTSYYNYSKFEDGKSGCKNISFYLKIRDELRESYPYLGNISDNILRALCFIYNEKISRQNNFNEEYCSYFYYWLGDKIYTLVHDKVVFSRIIKLIFQELNYSFSYDICKWLYEKIDKNTFNTYKLLFDYSKDYVNVNLSNLHGYTTCNEEYKKSIQNYISTYKDVHSYCTGTQGTKYDCEYFKKLFPIDEFDKLSSFICPQRQNAGAIIEELKEHRGQEAASSEIFRLDNATDSTFQHTTSSALELIRHQDKQNQKNIETIQPLKTNDSTDGGSSKTIAGSVAPVLGVSSISILLYKVTPLGGFINKLLGRNSNMYNPIEDIDGFNPYSDGMDPGGRRMNISYHRL